MPVRPGDVHLLRFDLDVLLATEWRLGGCAGDGYGDADVVGVNGDDFIDTPECRNGNEAAMLDGLGGLVFQGCWPAGIDKRRRRSSAAVTSPSRNRAGRFEGVYLMPLDGAAC